MGRAVNKDEFVTGFSIGDAFGRCKTVSGMPSLVVSTRIVALPSLVEVITPIRTFDQRSRLFMSVNRSSAFSRWANSLVRVSSAACGSWCFSSLRRPWRTRSSSSARIEKRRVSASDGERMPWPIMSCTWWVTLEVSLAASCHARTDANRLRAVCPACSVATFSASASRAPKKFLK